MKYADSEQFADTFSRNVSSLVDINVNLGGLLMDITAVSDTSEVTSVLPSLSPSLMAKT